jgi:hypothetical protein
VAAAAVVFWRRSPELPDDASTAGFYKSTSRQMGVMYGQFGVLLDELRSDLKRPGVQAIIILATATLAMFVCLYIARRLDGDARPDGKIS